MRKFTFMLKVNVYLLFNIILKFSEKTRPSYKLLFKLPNRNNNNNKKQKSILKTT